MLALFENNCFFFNNIIMEFEVEVVVDNQTINMIMGNSDRSDFEFR